MGLLGRLILVGVILVGLPAGLRAQEATLTGAVTDATGGVLPGVTVTAVHEATGNRFVAVTGVSGSADVAVRRR